MKGKNKCVVLGKYKTPIVETKVENGKTEKDLEQQAIYAFKCVKRKMMLEAMLKTVLIIFTILFFRYLWKIYIKEYIYQILY